MNVNAEIVREKRLQKGWTQQQLGDVAGLSLRTIQRVESQGQGSLETCNAICAVLEVAREDLLSQTPSADQGRAKPVWLLPTCLALLIGFAAGVVVTVLFNGS
ncbi:helix-turn-helix transcriptional regulator [Aliidiomarina haloalkalitolerans]|mgnify:CR=1 FL=1|uniref:XRE family transcriptional regulator n=1 Tax=Aliidiomarina haloalkalitolerans TaxID=859059 RepID=A0A432VRY5_9GAMM|nr:helix-turn-helix transcriptional regulator [Aliidiomarina haloalkalitolerans]RUO19120.1 XRE family transcriptional regulator [Aliidiomarina haloalkalitolerans]